MTKLKIIALLLPLLLHTLRASSENQTVVTAQPKIDNFLKPPPDKLVPNHQETVHVQTAPKEEQSFISKVTGWLFPFGDSSSERPLDVVPAETQQRYAPQYLPPPAQSHPHEEQCNPCNKEPWIPVAATHNHKTVIGFVQPSQFGGQGYVPPANAYGPPQNVYGPPSNAHGSPLNAHGSSLDVHGSSLNVHGSPQNVYGPPANAHGSPLNAHGSSLNVHGSSLNVYGPPANAHGSPLNVHGSSLNVHGSSPNLYGPPSNVHGSSHAGQAPPSNFQQHLVPPSTQYGTPFNVQQHQQTPPAVHPQYGVPKDQYGLPTNVKPNFGPPPDNFRQLPQYFVPPPLGKHGKYLFKPVHQVPPKYAPQKQAFPPQPLKQGPNKYKPFPPPQHGPPIPLHFGKLPPEKQKLLPVPSIDFSPPHNFKNYPTIPLPILDVDYVQPPLTTFPLTAGAVSLGTQHVSPIPLNYEVPPLQVDQNQLSGSGAVQQFSSFAQNRPAPFPEASLSQAVPVRNAKPFQNGFDNVPQHGTKVETHSSVGKAVQDVQIIPSIRVADYIASIEHPISVFQSPLVEVIASQHNQDVEDSKADVNDNSPSVHDDDIHAAATVHNTSFHGDNNQKRNNDKDVAVPYSVESNNFDAGKASFGAVRPSLDDNRAGFESGNPSYNSGSSLFDGGKPFLEAARPFEAGKPSYDIIRPSFNDGKPSFDVGSSSFDSGRPSFDGTSSFGAGKHSYNVGSSSIDNGKPSFDAVSVFDAGKPSHDVIGPSINAGKPSFDVGTSSFDSGKHSFDSTRAIGTEKPSFDIGKPSFEAGKPSYNSGSSGFDPDRPSFDATRPLDAGKPSYDISLSSFNPGKPTFDVGSSSFDTGKASFGALTSNSNAAVADFKQISSHGVSSLAKQNTASESNLFIPDLVNQFIQSEFSKNGQKENQPQQEVKQSQYHFTQPPLDYSNWSPSHVTPSTSMVPPALGNEPTWFTSVAPVQQIPSTTKKPKQVQIIIPYTSNNNGKGSVNKGTTSLPLYTQPPSIGEPVWSHYTNDYREEESKKVTATATTERPRSSTVVTNIRDLLLREEIRTEATKHLPFDIVRLQKNIDDWTQQEFSSNVLSLPKPSTTGKLVPSKKIPTEYLTTQPYNVAGSEATTTMASLLDLFFDHEPAGSSNKISKVESDEDVDTNLILTETTSLPPTTTAETPVTTTARTLSSPNKITTTTTESPSSTVASVATPASGTTLPIATPRPAWEKLEVSFSPLTKERVYVVTPQPWNFTPQEINDKLLATTEPSNSNGRSTSAKFSVVIQPEGRNRKGNPVNGTKNGLHIVYSEWPHLINNLITTTSTEDSKSSQHPLLGLMDLSSYTPPPNATVETYGGHSRVITVVTPASVTNKGNSEKSKGKTTAKPKSSA